jgi:putative ABC transport system permease protein
VSRDYFTTLRIPLLRGRSFRDADMDPDAHVAISSESLVRKYWPDGDAIGHHLTVARQAPHLADAGQPITLEIIGIAHDVKQYGLDDPPSDVIYLPNAADPWPGAFVVARVASPDGPSLPTLRKVVAGGDADITVSREAASGEQLVANVAGRNTYLAALLTAFAGMALILATVGVFGIVSYSVSERRAEIGVRRALGAPAGRIVALVVGRGLIGVALGGAAGLVIAALGARVLASLLYGISVHDVAVYASVVVAVVAAAAVASYLPVRAATRISPVEALRS